MFKLVRQIRNDIRLWKGIRMTYGLLGAEVHLLKTENALLKNRVRMLERRLEPLDNPFTTDLRPRRQSLLGCRHCGSDDHSSGACPHIPSWAKP